MSSSRAGALSTRLGELASLSLRLGLLGFGGPAALIAWLQEEVVDRRRWISRERFLDLLGAAHLIPGPNTTELLIHLGLVRAGWLGLLVAGAGFIVPAASISAFLAWVHLEYGARAAVEPFLAGLKPAVLGVIAVAVVKLGRTSIRGWKRAGIGVAVALAVLLGAGEITALLAGGLAGALLLLPPRPGGGARPGAQRRGPTSSSLLGGLGLSALWRPVRAAALAPLGGWLAVGIAQGSVAFSLGKLALFFLQVGSVLYGGGYVLIAFLQGGLVENWGWLSERELLDAVAIGQVTPGPLLSTASFIGFRLAGPLGAAVSTGAIFLPSFLFVLAVHPLLGRLQKSPAAGAFLAAVTVSAVALMAVTTVRLGDAILWRGPHPAWGFGIALAAVLLQARWRVHPGLVVLAGALLGWVPVWFS